MGLSALRKFGGLIEPKESIDYSGRPALSSHQPPTCPHQLVLPQTRQADRSLSPRQREKAPISPDSVNLPPNADHVSAERSAALGAGCELLGPTTSVAMCWPSQQQCSLRWWPVGRERRR